MGSQNVTDFRSAAQKQRIRAAIERYDPKSDQARQQGRAAGAVVIEALGNFTKTHEYVQALSSPPFRSALDLLISFAESIRKARKREQINQTLIHYGVNPEVSKPFGPLTAWMQKSLAERSIASSNRYSIFAAKDAIPKTVIDVLSEVIPREKAASASTGESARAFKKVKSRRIATLYLENVIGSLISLGLDAARGPIPPGKVAKLKNEIRASFAPEFARIIMRSAKRRRVSPKNAPSQAKEAGVVKAINKKVKRYLPREGPLD